MLFALCALSLETYRWRKPKYPIDYKPTFLRSIYCPILYSYDLTRFPYVRPMANRKAIPQRRGSFLLPFIARHGSKFPLYSMMENRYWPSMRSRKLQSNDIWTPPMDLGFGVTGFKPGMISIQQTWPKGGIDATLAEQFAKGVIHGNIPLRGDWKLTGAIQGDTIQGITGGGVYVTKRF